MTIVVVAPTKKPLGKGKRHNAVCNIAALNETNKNNQVSARTTRPHSFKEGGSSSLCFGHTNLMLLNVRHTEDTKNEANNILHKLMCEEQHMHNERVWNTKHGLVHHSFAAVLLLDEL